MKTGLIVGKFYPPTLGHLYLIEEAKKSVDFLMVVVGGLPSQNIPGEQRTEWLKTLVGTNTMVLHVPDDNPVGLTDKDAEYWQIWKNNLKKNLPFIPEQLFSSEYYGDKLAEVMGMKHTMVDAERLQVPISATQVRDNPLKYLKFIPPVVQKYYTKQIPEAIISDLDGTLALLKERSPYDSTTCYDDDVNNPVLLVLKQFEHRSKLIFMSGRWDTSIKTTRKWLEEKAGFKNFLLYLRPVGDKRKDAIIKKELYEKYVKGKYNILFVLDDRKQMKRMWVEEGLFVFDVNQNDLEF